MVFILFVKPVKSIFSIPLTIESLIELIALETSVINGESALCTPSMKGIKALNTFRKPSYAGVATSAPILDKAAFMLDKAPLNVLFASFACSPNALSIAAANVAKSILPLVVISRTSASVIPRYFANVAAAFIPLLESCSS